MEFPVALDNIPDADAVLEPELVAVLELEEEEEDEELAAGGVVLALREVQWVSWVFWPNIQMVSPASLQTSLKYLVASSS